MIEFGTARTALHQPRRVWVDRDTRRCGVIGQDMPEDVRAAAKVAGVRF